MGIIGLIFCIWMLTQLIGLFKDKTVSLILKVGVIAVLVDAMFSGSMVYPASNCLCIIYSFYFSHRELTSSSQYSSRSTKILIALWGVLFLYITIMYLGQDLTCWSWEAMEDEWLQTFGFMVVRST